MTNPRPSEKYGRKGNLMKWKEQLNGRLSEARLALARSLRLGVSRFAEGVVAGTVGAPRKVQESERASGEAGSPRGLGQRTVAMTASAASRHSPASLDHFVGSAAPAVSLNGEVSMRSLGGDEPRTRR
jgi:hypothetical protein